MLDLLGTPSPISAIYANGYSSNLSSLSWRKPNPGMILAASKDLHINLSESILIGDRLTDLQAGASAKISTLVHVLTGKGQQERESIHEFFNASKVSLDTKNLSQILFLNSLKSFPIDMITSQSISEETLNV